MLDFSKRNSRRQCGKSVESGFYFSEKFCKMGKTIGKQKFPAQFVENQPCWEFYLFHVSENRLSSSPLCSWLFGACCSSGFRCGCCCSCGSGSSFFLFFNNRSSSLCRSCSSFFLFFYDRSGSLCRSCSSFFLFFYDRSGTCA